MIRGRNWIPTVGTQAIVTSPRCALPLSRISTSAPVRSSSSRRARGRNARPMSVSATERVEPDPRSTVRGRIHDRFASIIEINQFYSRPERLETRGMVNIDSTPDMATRVYARIARNLERARRRIAAPLTLADKLLLGHLADPECAELAPGAGELRLLPDRVVLQDVLGQTAMLQFLQTRRDRVAVPTTIHCDHLIQARADGESDLRDSLAENGEIYAFLR